MKGPHTCTGNKNSVSLHVQQTEKEKTARKAKFDTRTESMKKGGKIIEFPRALGYLSAFKRGGKSKKTG